MKKCPHFMRGRLRQCFAVALRERQRARGVQDSQTEERAWKLFGLVVPVMLLHRPRGTGSVGKDELLSRSDNFAKSRWSELLNGARETYEQPRSVNKVKNDAQELQRRGRAALGRVRQGQLSKARPELMGAALAPKTLDTLEQLQERRPQIRVKEIFQEVMGFVPDRPLELDVQVFTKCLQSAPGVLRVQGSAPTRCCECALISSFSGQPKIVQQQAFMSATMTALQKPDGGVRGHCNRHIFPTTGGTPVWKGSGSGHALLSNWHCRARTVSDMPSGQLQKPIITRLCCTGVGAYDHVYRAAMMEKLHQVPSLQGLLLFVRATYANPISYVWEDEDGVQHRIVQAEGGEQGDPLSDAVVVQLCDPRSVATGSDGIQS